MKCGQHSMAITDRSMTSVISLRSLPKLNNLFRCSKRSVLVSCWWVAVACRVNYFMADVHSNGWPPLWQKDIHRVTSAVSMLFTVVDTESLTVVEDTELKKPI